jgi:hypothetical protein
MTGTTCEVWAYGVVHPTGIATLGRVEFDELGQVCDVVGESGNVIDSALDELELRRLLQSLHGLPNLRTNPFDCYQLLVTANAFQPLGQSTTFKVIREYERVSESDTNDEGIYLLLYLLHETPESGSLPELPLGFCSATYPGVEEDFPRFPIHLLGGVPILLTPWYTFAGGRPPIDGLLQQLKRSALWIRSPIQLDNRPINELTLDLKRLVASKKLFFEHQSKVKIELILAQLEMFVEKRNQKMIDKE